MKKRWQSGARNFLRGMYDDSTGGYRSVPGGAVTLYGTSYAILGSYYLCEVDRPSEKTKQFISRSQNKLTGLFAGPELASVVSTARAIHDQEHLLLHQTCAVLPVCLQFNIPVHYRLHYAHRLCDLRYLREWLNERNLRNAWLEGNNLLFVGQLLVYLRDKEKYEGADRALMQWFEWLDQNVDVESGLWGTDKGCSVTHAVYGGYHQLLVYYHEGRNVRNPPGLIDAVLGLQHGDGGFNPAGNGGACEDVDCVDMLVNLYKLTNYRHADIRRALRRCMRHILDLQNTDGGFPYNRDCQQSHMEIPATIAEPNKSTTFATWFRVHTLALMAEILTDEPDLQFPFRFTDNLSMGWHHTWDKTRYPIKSRDYVAEVIIGLRAMHRRACHKLGWQ